MEIKTPWGELRDERKRKERKHVIVEKAIEDAELDSSSALQVTLQVTSAVRIFIF